jgi:hypothetical protein
MWRRNTQRKNNLSLAMQAAIFAGELGHVKTASVLRFWHVGDPQRFPLMAMDR